LQKFVGQAKRALAKATLVEGGPNREDVKLNLTTFRKLPKTFFLECAPFSFSNQEKEQIASGRKLFCGMQIAFPSAFSIPFSLAVNGEMQISRKRMDFQCPAAVPVFPWLTMKITFHI